MTTLLELQPLPEPSRGLSMPHCTDTSAAVDCLVEFMRHEHYLQALTVLW
jgi:hypothetical protein